MLEDTIAGYRVLRKLGSGSRSDVYLGHSAALEAAGVTALAALKCFRTDAESASITAELGALSAVEHPHVVQLRDVSRAGTAAPTLILERLERGSLARLVANRGALSAGEAVTVLAPLAAALGAVHASGHAHGSLAAGSVLFRGSGAPVLSGFGRACGLDEVALDRDNRALVSLALHVLGHGAEVASVRDWLSSLSVFPDAVLTQFSDRLFELAEAAPVRFDEEAGVRAVIPARVVTSIEPVSSVVEPVETVVARASSMLTPVLDRVPPRFRSPKYVAAASGALALLIAIAVVPSGGENSAALTPTVAPTQAAVGPVVEDDPVAAFGELVAARNRCIRDLSILCLSSVLQENSGAMDDDVALIQSIERGDGGAAVLDPLNVDLGERMGDAALVTYEIGPNHEPASALLVKSEAGWRIRTYLPG